MLILMAEEKQVKIESLCHHEMDVGLNPAWFTTKTLSKRKVRGNHCAKSHFSRNALPLVSANLRELSMP